VGLQLVGNGGFCMRGTIVSLIKDGAQETAVRGEGQRMWFLLAALLVGFPFASNACNTCPVAGKRWRDWVGCGSGMSGCIGFVVIHRDESQFWIGIVMCGNLLNVIVVC